jgi:hypothetical protein
MNTRTAPDTPRRFSFLRSVPERAQPSLLCSLESFETSLFVLALGRHRAALGACVEAWECALCDYFNEDAVQDMPLHALVARIGREKSALTVVDPSALQAVLDARRKPGQQHDYAQLLLTAGFPYLFDLYRGCFELHVDWRAAKPGITNFLELIGEPVAARCLMVPALADLLTEAIAAARELGSAQAHARLCLEPLAARIRAGLAHGFLTRRESSALEIGENHYHEQALEERREAIEHRYHGVTARFDCPFCTASEAFVCEFVDERFEAGELAFEHGQCADCDTQVTPAAAALLERWLAQELRQKAAKILQEWG